MALKLSISQIFAVIKICPQCKDKRKPYHTGENLLWLKGLEPQWEAVRHCIHRYFETGWLHWNIPHWLQCNNEINIKTSRQKTTKTQKYQRHLEQKCERTAFTWMEDVMSTDCWRWCLGILTERKPLRFLSAQTSSGSVLQDSWHTEVLVIEQRAVIKANYQPLCEVQWEWKLFSVFFCYGCVIKVIFLKSRLSASLAGECSLIVQQLECSSSQKMCEDSTWKLPVRGKGSTVILQWLCTSYCICYLDDGDANTLATSCVVPVRLTVGRDV